MSCTFVSSPVTLPDATAAISWPHAARVSWGYFRKLYERFSGMKDGQRALAWAPIHLQVFFRGFFRRGLYTEWRRSDPDLGKTTVALSKVPFSGKMKVFKKRPKMSRFVVAA